MLQSAHIDDWNVFYKKSTLSPFFLSPKWALLWENIYPIYRASPMMITLPSQKRALIPCVSQSCFFGSTHMLHSSPAGTYGGWLTEDGSILDTEETAFLLKTLFETSETLVLRLSPFLIPEQKKDSGPFTNVSGAGISCIPDQTYILDTRIGLEALEKRWKKKLGRKLKKAESSGVCIHRTDQNSDIERFYTLYKSCIETWSPPPGHIYPPEFIATLLKDTGSADLWIAEYESKVIAGAIIARGINHWAYWLGATDRNYSHLRAANLLHTQIIITQCNEGVQWYDFNPSAGLKGVEQFKASFGATKKAAPLFIKKRPFFHFLEKSSTLVKRFTSSISPT